QEDGFGKGELLLRQTQKRRVAEVYGVERAAEDADLSVLHTPIIHHMREGEKRFSARVAAWTALFGAKSVMEGCAMGKTIDRAALHVLSALGLYLCFVSALGHVWLAAGCALAALLLLRKLLMPLAGRLPKREARKGRARAEVERWALLE